MITDEQKIKLNELISSVEQIISRLDKGVVRGQEAVDFLFDGIRHAKGLFDKASDEWRIIDRWEQDNGFHWKHKYLSGSYAGAKEKEKLSKLLEVLNKLLPEGSSTSKNENHFSINQAYEAKRYIAALFRSAGNKIIIVDEHLDDQFFAYVDIVPESIKIKIITGEKKKIFWDLLNELRKKRMNIDARVNGISHCRYVVIDDVAVYSTDASLNTIGKKAFMIHKLENEEEIEKVKKEIREYWNIAKIV